MIEPERFCFIGNVGDLETAKAEALRLARELST